MYIILENVPNAETLIKLVIMYFQVHKQGIYGEAAKLLASQGLFSISSQSQTQDVGARNQS